MTVGVARVSKPFQRGIDCLSPMANNIARMFHADGYDFVGRYVENLTEKERDGIFAAGLGILLITEAITTISLDGALGTLRGTKSVELANDIGVPHDVHIAIDLESTKGTPNGIAAYVDMFHLALVTGGFSSMLYVGSGQPFSGKELFALSPHRYWRSGSFVPEPDCGWCCLQLSPLDQTIHGQRVDVDVIQNDYKDRTPTLWYPS